MPRRRRPRTGEEWSSLSVHIPKPCAVCGADFDPRAATHKYCSKQCAWKAAYLAKSPDQQRAEYDRWVASGKAAEASRRRRQTEAGKAESRQRTKWRRAITRGALVVDKFDPHTVYERDGWRCHLCRRAIPRKALYPNPKSASLDHIIPLSLGGEHSLANVAAAHLACNLAKSNRAESDQLRLIG